jgi:hypothetical protein
MRCIAIKQLCSACGTRARAQEAVKELRELVQREPVELDLSGTATVSTSFLDELVYQLLPFTDSQRIIFRVGDADTERKLERVAGIRSARLFSRSSNGMIHQVASISPRTYPTTFVTTKTPEPQYDESATPS